MSLPSIYMLSADCFVLTEKTVRINFGEQTLSVNLFAEEKGYYFGAGGSILSKLPSIQNARRILARHSPYGAVLCGYGYVLFENITSPYFMRGSRRVREGISLPLLPDVKGKPLGLIDAKTMRAHEEGPWTTVTPLEFRGEKKVVKVHRKYRTIIRDWEQHYEVIYQLPNKRYVPDATLAKYSALLHEFAQAKKGLHPAQLGLAFIKTHGTDASEAVGKYLESRGEAKAGKALAAAGRFLL